MSRAIFGAGRIPGPMRVQTDHASEAKAMHVRGRSELYPARAAVTSKSGKIPQKDGEDNEYITHPFQWNLLIEQSGRTARRVASRGARRSSAPVFFVNGIKGSGKKHMQQALMTSAFSGGPVTGIFNQSEGMAKDLLQCINDKRTSAEFMSAKGTVGGWIDSLADFVGLGGKESTAQNWVEESISDNRATLALFRKLLEPGCQNATVVAHSQGNIIAANALNAVAALRGKDAIANMRVISVGSPVVFWSNVKNVHSFGFKNDAVALMSFSVGDHSAYAGENWYTGMATVEDPHGTEEPTGLESSFKPWQQLTHTYFLYVARYWDELVALFP